MADASNTPKDIQPDRDRGGQWVAIGGERYKIPPLSLKAVRDLQDKVEDLKSIAQTGVPNPEQMQTVHEIVLAALRRNYTNMTIEDVEDMIDLGNYLQILNACLSIAGFERRAEGEGAPQGEASASTGTTSTSP